MYRPLTIRTWLKYDHDNRWPHMVRYQLKFNIQMANTRKLKLIDRSVLFEEKNDNRNVHTKNILTYWRKSKIQYCSCVGIKYNE